MFGGPTNRTKKSAEFAIFLSDRPKSTRSEKLPSSRDGAHAQDIVPGNGQPWINEIESRERPRFDSAHRFPKFPANLRSMPAPHFANFTLGKVFEIKQPQP
jgi:hypothetical protein